MHIGKRKVEGGRCSEPAVHNLTEVLHAGEFARIVMKTGTPVRIDKRSVHFDEMEAQPGENDITNFIYRSLQKPSTTTMLVVQYK